MTVGINGNNMEREELLKNAKALYECHFTSDKLKHELEDAFPELKESEDEMIRNDIMEAVENWFPYKRVEEIRAYLRTRKEQ